MMTQACASHVVASLGREYLAYTMVLPYIKMLQIFLLNLAVTAAVKMEPYIVGGQEVSIRKWPFIAFVESSVQSSYYTGACGGSLLSSQTVLTAAHCLDDITRKKKEKGCSFRIYMGHSSFAEATMSRIAVDYETPRGYDPEDGEVRFDIGVMFLVKPVAFSSRVQKVILQRHFNSKNTNLFVAGWGTTDPAGNNGISQRLKAVKMVLKKYKLCKSMHKVICTTASENNYPFTGDSGGPLVNADNLRQVGIVSFRDPTTGISAFTNVPEYYDWIQKMQLQLFNRHCKSKKGK